MKRIPKQFKGRIEYGLYGGIVQFYITQVDGTLAQLGRNLPPAEQLEKIIRHAKKEHQKLVKHFK